MKTAVEQQLLDALNKLDNAIKAMPAIEAKPKFLLLFGRIDELAEQLPRDADPTLLHYLHKKSYEKARLLLQNRDEENISSRCR